MKHILLTTAVTLAASALSVQADEISDTLESSLKAYTDGDLQYALEELNFARQLMIEKKTEALSAFLPEAPEGWTREVNSEMGASLGMLGGGVGAEAEYSKGSESFKITIMADNPMVSAMGGMIGNAAAYGAKVERVGREKFMVQDSAIQGLIDNRILVKAEGTDMAQMISVLESMDFRELGRFGN